MKDVITEPAEGPRPEPRRWSLATRIAFRFLFSYYTLTRLLPYLLVHSELLREKHAAFWDAVVAWADETLFHMSYEVFDPQTDAYAWVQLFCALAFAGVTAAVWSVLDRNRLHYARLHPWLRFGLRYLLAAA